MVTHTAYVPAAEVAPGDTVLIAGEWGRVAATRPGYPPTGRAQLGPLGDVVTLYLPGRSVTASGSALVACAHPGRRADV